MINKLKLGFLASGGGSNFAAIVQSINSGKLDAEAKCIISNNSNAGALEKAYAYGIPNYHISNVTHVENTAQAIIDTFKNHDVNTIILAGYMKIVQPEIIDAFNGRVLNIHPALLPKFGGKGMYGMNVHRAVIETGEKKSGATIHLVNAKYDEGRILHQRVVDVYGNDTPETLAARVLAAEHILFSETLQKIAIGEIII